MIIRFDKFIKKFTVTRVQTVLVVKKVAMKIMGLAPIIAPVLFLPKSPYLKRVHYMPKETSELFYLFHTNFVFL